MVVIDCDTYNCKYNEGGICTADMIQMEDRECQTYEDNSYEMMDDIEREEFNKTGECEDETNS